MERVEYFSQEIKQKEAKGKRDEADVRKRMKIVKNPILWQQTYEEVAANAWRKIDVSNMAV